MHAKLHGILFFSICSLYLYSGNDSEIGKEKANPFIPDGNSHLYQQDQSIYVLRVASLDFFILTVNLVLVRKLE